VGLVGYEDDGGMMWGWMPGFLLAFSAVSLVSGGAIVTAAYMLYNKPSQAQTWGTVVLVFAVVGLLSASGFIVGALLAIVGGLLALTWRRQT
jgi:multisubunit Na+/H+ antiporter MnhG subunit